MYSNSCPPDISVSISNLSTDRSFLKLAEEEYTGLPNDVSVSY